MLLSSDKCDRTLAKLGINLLKVLNNRKTDGSSETVDRVMSLLKASAL